MTDQALISMQSARHDAVGRLSAHVLNELYQHLDTCAKNGRMQPFSLKITTNADDETVAEALKRCAIWTDRNGNKLTSDYVWMDTDQPDFIKNIEDLADIGVIGGLLAAAVAAIPVFGQILLLSAAIDFTMFAGQPKRERLIMFTPSSVRAYLRTPVRAYNVAGGYVTVATNTIGTLADTATSMARQGIGLAAGLFRKRKSP